MVYQIICGDGRHAAQFDEQLRLIAANDADEAFAHACRMGYQEEESFLNQKNEWVRWQFVNVMELLRLHQVMDGAEIYSRINEVEDADAYIRLVHHKAESIRDKQSHQLLNLI